LPTPRAVRSASQRRLTMVRRKVAAAKKLAAKRAAAAKKPAAKRAAAAKKPAAKRVVAKKPAAKKAAAAKKPAAKKRPRQGAVVARGRKPGRAQIAGGDGGAYKLAADMAMQFVGALDRAANAVVGAARPAAAKKPRAGAAAAKKPAAKRAAAAKKPAAKRAAAAKKPRAAAPKKPRAAAPKKPRAALRVASGPKMSPTRRFGWENDPAMVAAYEFYRDEVVGKELADFTFPEEPTTEEVAEAIAAHSVGNATQDDIAVRKAVFTLEQKKGLTFSVWDQLMDDWLVFQKEKDQFART
jgi:hypothetical protein